MAWTAPRTWVAAETVTAAMLNAHVRDNLLMTAPSLVSAAGDLVRATGPNALSRLALGAAGLPLRVNDAGTDLLYAQLAAGAIADAAVSTTKLADAAVSTAKLAAGAGSGLLVQQQAAPAGSTTSATLVAMPAPFNSLSFTPSRSGFLLLSGSIKVAVTGHSTAPAVAVVWRVDGGAAIAATNLDIINIPNIGTTLYWQFDFSMAIAAGVLTNAAHTLEFLWSTNQGTLSTRTDVYSWVVLTEHR